MKVFNATYADKSKSDTIIPVAAQSLQHAARKATEKEEKYGELTKLELTEDVII